jgi:hypothetical protein
MGECARTGIWWVVCFIFNGMRVDVDVSSDGGTRVTLPPRSGPDEIAITWLWHPMKSTTILLLAASLYAETAAPFAPLEEWKAAVMSGDQTALARLYSSNPPAVAQVG